jgi:hypothetical protein
MEEQKKQHLLRILNKIKKEETESLNFLLPRVLSKQIATYMSMREDLLLIQRQTKLILENKISKKETITSEFQDTILPALWYSTIIMYGRCFTDASKAKFPKLEIKDCLLENYPELFETHEFLMDLRNNFIAHRGDSENERSVIYMKIPKGELTGKTEYRIKHEQVISTNTDRLKKCLSLFEHLLKIVEEKLQKSGEKIHAKFLEFKPNEMMFFLIR